MIDEDIVANGLKLPPTIMLNRPSKRVSASADNVSRV